MGRRVESEEAPNADHLLVLSDLKDVISKEEINGDSTCRSSYMTRDGRINI